MAVGAGKWTIALLLLLGSFPHEAPAEGPVLYSEEGIVPITDENREELFGDPRKSTHVSYTFHKITWNVEFNDVDTGFFDAVLGAGRRASLEAALKSLSDVLNQPGGIVDINISQSEDSPDLHWVAQSGPTAHGFRGGAVNNGSAFNHLLHPEVDSSQDLPDMRLRVNFGPPLSLGNELPNSGEIDLLGVLIHELTHGLGFLNVVAYHDDICGTGNERPDGSGWFGDTTGDNYTQFSLLLRRSDGTAIIGPDFTPLGNLDAFTGGPRALEFRGKAMGLFQDATAPLHTPEEYACRASISHWPSDVEALMAPTISVGEVKRSFASFEIAALVDIGYFNAAPPGEPSITQVAASLRTEFSTLDTGGDHRLDLPETRTVYPAMPRFNFRRIDVNNDSTLSGEELDAIGQVAGGGGEPVPDLQVTPVETLNFGTVTLGETSSASILVRNRSASRIEGAVVMSSGPFTYTGASISLEAGELHTTRVQFAPREEGLANANVTISSAGREDIVVLVRGAGVEGEGEGEGEGETPMCCSAAGLKSTQDWTRWFGDLLLLGITAFMLTRRRYY